MHQSAPPNTSPNRVSAFLTILSLQGLLVLAVGAVFFWLQRVYLLGYIDGQYLLTLLRNQMDFAPWVPFFSINPLEGLGDLWYFVNTLLVPEVAVASLFTDVGLQRTAAHCVASIEIFGSVAILARWLDWPNWQAIAAGWAAIIFIEPFSYPSLTVNISPDAPELASVIAVPLLILPLWAGIGTGRGIGDAIRVAVIALLMWMHFLAVSLFATLCYPFLFINSVVMLVAALPRREEFRRKMLWSGMLLALLILSGLPAAALGIVMDTAFQFFPGLLGRSNRAFGICSVLFQNDLGSAIALLGCAGMAGYTIFGRGRMRLFAIAQTIAVILLLIASLVYHWFGYKAAVPLYYEYVLWPLYALFALATVVAAIRRLQLGQTAGQPAFARMAAWVVLPCVALAIMHAPNWIRAEKPSRPNIFPPKPSLITDELKHRIGLALGAPFRGRVVTLTGQTSPAGLPWLAMFDQDLHMINLIGNDHRMIGLWYYNIPTLMEFSHTVTPLLFATTTRYLAIPRDPQFRTLLHMRRANVPILRLLGVSYIISDAPAPEAGTRRLMTLRLPNGARPVNLDAVPDANLGVSPTQPIQLESGKDAIAQLGRPGFDFEQQVILANPGLAPLLPARDIKITIERGGIRVAAHSSGTSIVVLPFQFSHCFHTFSRIPGGDPKLLRADVLLTGVVFKNRLDVTISYRAPFLAGAYCWLQNAADSRLLLVNIK